ncbi:MAG: CBS domain-containing protein [Rhodospirillales bacterium]
MRAKEIMTRNVRTVKPETPVRDIARLMHKQRVSAVPVVDRNRRVLGIVSEGDLMRRPEAGTVPRRSWWLDLLTDPASRAGEYAKTRGQRARDVMSCTVVSVTPDTEAAEIADILERWNIKRVPVVRGERLVGVVSRRDLLPAIVAQRRRGGKVTDAAIGAALRREIEVYGWTGGTLINIAVAKGVVELNGLVRSNEEREALRVMAEGIRGVRAVKDRLRVQPYFARGF